MDDLNTSFLSTGSIDKCFETTLKLSRNWRTCFTARSLRIACRFIFVFKIIESSVCVLNVFNFYTVYIQKFPYFIIEHDGKANWCGNA